MLLAEMTLAPDHTSIPLGLGFRSHTRAREAVENRDVVRLIVAANKLMRKMPMKTRFNEGGMELGNDDYAIELHLSIRSRGADFRLSPSSIRDEWNIVENASQLSPNESIRRTAERIHRMGK